MRFGDTGKRCAGGTAGAIACSSDGDCAGGGSCFASVSNAGLIQGINSIQFDGTTIGVDLSSIGANTAVNKTTLGPNNFLDTDTPYKMPASSSTITNMMLWHSGTVTNWSAANGVQTPSSQTISGTLHFSSVTSCAADSVWPTTNFFGQHADDCTTTYDTEKVISPAAAITVTGIQCQQHGDSSCSTFFQLHYDATGSTKVGSCLDTNGGGCYSTGLSANIPANTYMAMSVNDVRNNDCSTSGSPYPCCTGSGTGTCPAAFSCNPAPVGCTVQYTIQ